MLLLADQPTEYGLVWGRNTSDRQIGGITVTIDGPGRDGMWLDYIAAGDQRVIAILDEPPSSGPVEPVTITVASNGVEVASGRYEGVRKPLSRRRSR
ncbi:MAG: hypothetical protein AAGF91_03460 [Actinomycetota bacterium]